MFVRLSLSFTVCPASVNHFFMNDVLPWRQHCQKHGHIAEWRQPFMAVTSETAARTTVHSFFCHLLNPSLIGSPQVASPLTGESVDVSWQPVSESRHRRQSWVKFHGVHVYYGRAGVPPPLLHSQNLSEFGTAAIKKYVTADGNCSPFKTRLSAAGVVYLPP